LKNKMQDHNQNTNQTFYREYLGQVRRTLIYLFLWAAFVVISAYLTGNAPIIRGFLFGFAANVIYYILMFRRIPKIIDLPPDKAITYMRFGWIIRLIFILAMLTMALKIPGIEFLAAVCGLFSLKAVLFIQAAVMVILGVMAKIKLRKG